MKFMILRSVAHVLKKAGETKIFNEVAYIGLAKVPYYYSAFISTAKKLGVRFMVKTGTRQGY